MEKQRDRRKSYSKGVRGNLVNLILNNGAVTYRGMRMLTDLDRHYVSRLMKEMEKDEVVALKNIKHLKYVTLSDYHKLELLTSTYRRNGTWKGCDLNLDLVNNWKGVKKEDAEEIGKYREVKRSEVNRYRTNTNTAAIRKYKEAEVSQIMWHAGVRSMIIEKPSLLTLPASGPLVRPDGAESYYYTFDEIRKNSSYRVETDEELIEEQIMNSRALGSLFTPGGLYVIYHFGRQLQIWNKFQENIYKLATKKVSREKLGMKIGKSDDLEEGAIILSYKEDNLIKLIQPTNKNDITNQSKVIESEYPSIYYVPVDRNGYYQLKIYQRKGWMEEMKKQLLPKGCDMDASKLGRAAHGKLSDGTTNKVYYLFCNNNVKELLYFIDRASASPKTSYQIIAWRYMAGMFEFDITLPPNMEVEYVDIEDYVKTIGV